MAARGQKESEEESFKEEGFQAKEEGFQEEGFKAQEPSASPLGAVVLAFRVGCHMLCPPFFYVLRSVEPHHPPRESPDPLNACAVSRRAPNGWGCRMSSQS